MNRELIERTQEYLFASEEEMIQARLPEPVRVRLFRLRDMYMYWLRTPKLTEGAVAQEIQRRYKMSSTVAYDDVRLIKTAIGNLNQASKDYYRWVFMQRAEESFQMARTYHDPNAFARTLAAYGKYTGLDKEKNEGPDYSMIVPQTFEISGDPEVAGFKKIPNVEERARKITAEFIQDADYEIVEPKTKEDDTIHQ